MKEEELNRCQIQEWYPKFKSVSIKTQIHELPESCIQYLLDDAGPYPIDSITLKRKKTIRYQKDLEMSQNNLRHPHLSRNLN